MDASDDCGSVDAVNLRDGGGLSLLRKTCWKMVQKPLPCERTGALGRPRAGHQAAAQPQAPRLAG